MLEPAGTPVGPLHLCLASYWTHMMRNDKPSESQQTQGGQKRKKMLRIESRETVFKRAIGTQHFG